MGGYGLTVMGLKLEGGHTDHAVYAGWVRGAGCCWVVGGCTVRGEGMRRRAVLVVLACCLAWVRVRVRVKGQGSGGVKAKGKGKGGWRRQGLGSRRQSQHQGTHPRLRKVPGSPRITQGQTAASTGKGRRAPSKRVIHTHTHPTHPFIRGLSCNILCVRNV